MKYRNILIKFTLLVLLISISMYYCGRDSDSFKDLSEITKNNLNFAVEQYSLMLESLDTLKVIKQPRSIDKNGSLKLVSIRDWTSGFFPGVLWYLYEYSNNNKFKDKAVLFTEAMEEIQYFTGNHDIGFMINCSYGNALRLTENKKYEKILIQAAKTLIKRFRPVTGSIQSWPSSNRWGCPVIVDNMMNLELLFKATVLSGDSTFYNIAVKHAVTAQKNHYRKDFSSSHVVDYDTLSGWIIAKKTWQGYSDESSWARGQSWGLYGFVMCYRYTKRNDFLIQAKNIADFLLNNPNLPDDYVPYWDYDAPGIPDEPKDASAAAIMASALFELSTYMNENNNEYYSAACKIVKSLGSEKYRARLKENGNFLLKHCVGAKPFDIEVDVPLIYADYYFLEALLRMKNRK